MKKLYLIFLTSVSFAQQINTFDLAVLNTAIISTNVDLDKGRSLVVGNEDQYSAYFHYLLDTKSDEIIFGAGFDKNINEKTSVIYVARQSGQFRMAINAGWIKADDGYEGSFAGFSFSYNPKENNYIGINVNNLHKVDSAYKTDESHDYYQKMTPKLFGSYEVYKNIVVFGQLSSRVNDIAIKYTNDRFMAGAYYDNNFGLFAKFKVGRFTIMASSSDKINFGVGFE